MDPVTVVEPGCVVVPELDVVLVGACGVVE